MVSVSIICKKYFKNHFFSACSPSYDWMRNMSVRHPSNRHSTKKVTLVFNNLKPDELADQLTFLEFKAFRRITVNMETCLTCVTDLTFFVAYLIYFRLNLPTFDLFWTLLTYLFILDLFCDLFYFCFTYLDLIDLIWPSLTYCGLFYLFMTYL